MDKSRGLKPCGRGANKLFSPCPRLPAPCLFGQLTSLTEQKAAVHGREYIEVAPISIPDEPRQRTEHYSKRLRLPRAVHLSAFRTGTYRPWGWEFTLGESSVTPNQEAAQVVPLRDAETTSKSSSETTNPRGLVHVPPATSTLNASNHQQAELSPGAGGKSTRTAAQRLSQTGSELTTCSNKDAAKQPQKARRRSSAPPTSENQSGKRKRRPAVGNDSS